LDWHDPEALQYRLSGSETSEDLSLIDNRRLLTTVMKYFIDLLTISPRSSNIQANLGGPPRPE
jgi:hypothetical protein